VHQKDKLHWKERVKRGVTGTRYSGCWHVSVLRRTATKWEQHWIFSYRESNRQLYSPL